MPTTTAIDTRQPIPDTPPLNWRREMPRYRVRAETRPAPKTRFRFEPPFAQIMDSNEWQYGERVWPAGSVIETDLWPCAGTFVPLNYSAREVLFYLKLHQKSRLPRSPYGPDGRLRLDDGLTNSAPKVVAPQPEPVRMHPRQAWPDM
jgi:hypothetical protein